MVTIPRTTINKYLRPPEASDAHMTRSEANYWKLAGDFRYLANCTRQDLCYVTDRLRAELHRPTIRNLRAMKAVIRYLARTNKKGINYRAG